MVMAGVPLNVVAAKLGHADTRMTERHYAHLAPSYVAETIRKFTPTFGAPDDSNVVPMARG
jgi:intergrase/recombinase